MHLFLDRERLQSTPELLSVIYWFRQILAVVIGLIWGVIPVMGATGIIGFLSLAVVIVLSYCNSYLQIDEEAHGGRLVLLKEGLFTSFALFILVWIITYTLVQL
ncbi:hypothetical protein P9112_010720 [Eukaryota sp. TZLM1-RC]